MCLHKQDPWYASGPKYAKILNMAKFWMSQVSQYASVEQRSEYILNSEYVWIYNNIQGPEYVSYNTQHEVTLQVN